MASGDMTDGRNLNVNAFPNGGGCDAGRRWEGHVLER